MAAVKFGVAVVAMALTMGTATAQPPVWVGGPVPPGELWGYSPLVPSIDPFPSKTSPYANSIFIPGVGGKRVYPSLVTNPRRRGSACPAGPTVVEVRHAPRGTPTVLPAAYEVVGPVARPLPAQGLHRFVR